VLWSDDPAQFVIGALAPANVSSIVVDEEKHSMDVVVDEENLAIAIGRAGQNVRLASQLTGWDIDILTEAEESERRQKEFVERTNLFMGALDVDEVVAQLLASEGFRSLEELAYVEAAELSNIEGFDEDTAAEIQSRARGHLDAIEKEHDDKRLALGVADELKEIDGITTAMLVALGENDVKTVEDFAGCVPDDLVGYTERKDGEAVRIAGYLDGFEISREDAEAMIMQARIKVGWVEAEVEGEAEGDEAPADEEVA